jgi:hypothetical protein
MTRAGVVAAMVAGAAAAGATALGRARSDTVIG